MKVLFTHSYFLKFDPAQWKQMRPYPPLGTMYAAALLRSHGFEVALHDVMFEQSPLSIEPAIQSFRPDLVVIYDDGFNYLTKMCLGNMRDAAFTMAALGKKYGCTVLVSSSDAADHFEKYLAQGADFIIIGEGEQTLLELATGLRDSIQNYNRIPGLAIKDGNGSIVRTLPRKVLHELDLLPMPAWDLVNMPLYREKWMASTGYFSINMSTTRGCPFKCNWCAKPIYGNRYNVRSPEHVVKELLILKETFHYDHIWFCDDIFGLKPGWVKKFADLLAENQLRIRFKIQSRADLLLNDQQTAALASAGCETAWIGAESGSQRILDAMDKGITIHEIGEATRLLKNNGIKVAYFLQFGYPGETKEDIGLTMKMLAANMPGDIGISVSYPLPGTKFYENVKEQLKTKTNWTDSGDLDMMFGGTYRARFYRSLHRYVHAWFRKATMLARKRFSLAWLAKVAYFTMQEVWWARIIKKTTADGNNG